MLQEDCSLGSSLSEGMSLTEFYDKEITHHRDWRLPENRMEGFLRWLKWRLKYSDLDHYGCNNAYRDYAGMTKEQQYWFSLIFGMTYQSEMAWVIFSQFPDWTKIDLEKLQEWNVKNLPRQKYAKDTKYNKGRITEQLSSIKKSAEPFGSLTNFFESSITVPGQKSFEVIYEKVGTLHKYGRMTQWITLQTLYETAGLPIAPNTMLAWDESAWSVRSGLMYLYGKDDKLEAKGAKLDSDDIDWVRGIEAKLLETCVEYLDGEYDVSNYLIESHLCQYKKLMLGGDYAGHSTGDHVSRATTLSELWPEVEFKPFWDFHGVGHYKLLRGKTENKALRNLTCRTGQMINMHEDFPDMPNMYEELGITLDDISNEPDKLAKVNSAIDAFADRIAYA